jgi:hypothetical protein
MPVQALADANAGFFQYAWRRYATLTRWQGRVAGQFPDS